MTWLRIDDAFYDHPKVVQAGPLCIALHVCALAYCSRHLTDGRVPRAMIPHLAHFDGIQLTRDSGSKRSGPNLPIDVFAIAERLVEVELWEHDGQDFLIHDYLEYNPTRVDVEERRAIRTNAGRIGGIKSGESRGSKGQANRSPLVHTMLNPVPSRPVPRPVGTSSATQSLPAGSEKRPTKTRALRVSGKEKAMVIGDIALALKRHSYPSLDGGAKSIVASQIGDLLRGGWALDEVRATAIEVALEWDQLRGFSKLLHLSQRQRAKSADAEREEHEKRKREYDPRVSELIAVPSKAMVALPSKPVVWLRRSGGHLG